MANSTATSTSGFGAYGRLFQRLKEGTQEERDEQREKWQNLLRFHVLGHSPAAGQYRSRLEKLDEIEQELAQEVTA